MRTITSTTLGIYASLLLLLNSCYSIMGLNKNIQYTQESINEYATKYNIPPEYSYALDTTYFDFLKPLKTPEIKAAVKNHLQPLQALYHDKNGQLAVFYINCYAEGFPNLKWNKNNILETFPPQQQAPIDSILPLKKHLTLLEPVNETAILLQQIQNQEQDIILVYWSMIMGRQSKRFIKAIQHNKTLSDNPNTTILYVNADLVLSNYATK